MAEENTTWPARRILQRGDPIPQSGRVVGKPLTATRGLPVFLALRLRGADSPVETIFTQPSHPYTKGLINSLPKDVTNEKLETITGAVPHPAFLPEGCAFHPRCPDKMTVCSQEMPKLKPIETERAQHLTACWLYDEFP